MGNYRRSSYNFYRPRWKGTYRPIRRESSERALNAKQQTTADDDILLILYRMIDDPNSRNRLTILLNAYRRIHGNSAGDYIITALPKWRTGTTKVAQQTIDRLVSLVPRVLTHDERYIVLRKVYQEHRYLLTENHTLTIVVGHNTQAVMREIDILSTRLMKKAEDHSLPEHVQKRMSWVCNEDAKLARTLMATIEQEETALIADAASIEVRRLISLINGTSGSSYEGTHRISYPYGTVSVTVRQPTFFEKLGKLFS
jgi:hypothetical protein